MKTILVPTDFSENSINATEYAGHLAMAFKAKIILFHVYDIPISERKVASPIITLEEVEKNLTRTCVFFKDKLQKNISQDIEIEYVIRKGEAEKEIIDFAGNISADLIVMGIIGMSRIDELLIGSVASATIRNATCPVLVVPSIAKFNKIERIVFALDSHNLQGSTGLSLLKEIISTYQAKVFVLNILEEGENENTKQNPSINLPAIFVDNINYSISFHEGENVVKGIHDFAEENQADLVAMIPHKHSLIQRLFLDSNTREVAYQTKIPLLALPENNH